MSMTDNHIPATNSGDHAAVPCSLVHDLLPAAVGGELESETEVVLERHLGECLFCRRELMALTDAQAALRTLREPECNVDDRFFADLHRDIVGEVRRRTRVEADVRHLAKARKGRRTLSRWSVVPVVGALAATLLVGFLLGGAMDRYRDGGSANTAVEGRSVSTVSSLRDLVTDPQFTPFLLEAMRSYMESRTATHQIGQTAKGLVPLPVGPARTPDERDF